MNDTNERDLAHEADMRQLRREQLEADCGGDQGDSEGMGDPDEYDFDVCPRCHDDGRDPWNDYLLPCPVCQGEQTP